MRKIINIKNKNFDRRFYLAKLFFLITLASLGGNSKVEANPEYMKTSFPDQEGIKNLSRNPFKRKEPFSELRELPRKTISHEEQKISLIRNPFSPANKEGSTEASFISNKIIFTGIAKVGDSKVVFGKTNRGLISFPLGYELGNGFSIVDINAEKSEIKVSNGVITYKYKFDKK
tara:strand:- start:124 stop:645 length:522 start_codon:yes stop_codon:yes gene_type:complete